jgi:[protein-PII] uridylyltransferase
MTNPGIKASATASHRLTARAVWQQSRTELFTHYRDRRRIMSLWRGLTEATDQLIVDLAGTGPLPFAVVATGGYGRCQLFPYSDIDVLLLMPDDAPQDEAAAQDLLYGLWDLPVAIGHAVRNTEECIGAALSDHTIAASLLDHRFITGDAALYRKFAKRFSREVMGHMPLQFVEAKLHERDARHTRALDTRYVLEPNVKEGKGGIRDLNTIWWLARYCYGIVRITDLARENVFTAEDARDYTRALHFLSAVRASLHLAYGRAEERLTFDAQLLLAREYHYRQSGEKAAARFMKHYFRHATRVGSLTRSFCTLLEEEKKRSTHSRITDWFLRDEKIEDFVLSGQRLLIPDSKQVEKDPLLMLRLFHTAQAHGLDVHPTSLRHVHRNLRRFGRKQRENPEAVRLFKGMLFSPKNPDAILRQMLEVGLLARMIPEFVRITGQMQYDRYHVYTVDEHTLKAIAALVAIESGTLRETFPLATQLMPQAHSSRAALYLAMLLHDIGKGEGNQLIKGAELAAVIARRLQCSEGEIALVVWLVRNHLLMSETAFKRDLDDPKTMTDFIEAVQSPERLRLLLLITAADIHAVGPNVWNGWKGALLRELYARALAAMGGSEAQGEPSEGDRAQLMSLLREQGKWDIEVIRAFVDRIAPAALFTRPPERQLVLATVYFEYCAAQHPVISVESDQFRSVTRMTLAAPAQGSLLHQAAGVCALLGASIIWARLMTTRDDVCWLSMGLQEVTGEAFAPEKLATFTERLASAQRGEIDFEAALLKCRPRYFHKTHAFEQPPRALIDNTLSATHSVIEISGADRIGLLHDIALALARLNVVIGSAQVATYGRRAVDVFYVKDAFGHQLTHPARRAEVENAVLRALGEA